MRHDHRPPDFEGGRDEVLSAVAEVLDSEEFCSLHGSFTGAFCPDCRESNRELIGHMVEWLNGEAGDAQTAWISRETLLAEFAEDDTYDGATPVHVAIDAIMIAGEMISRGRGRIR